jgi:hypothetical protein
MVIIASFVLLFVNLSFIIANIIESEEIGNVPTSSLHRRALQQSTNGDYAEAISTLK